MRSPLQAPGEGGFTLIELLVVMIVVGVLAAIAIPTFVSQRAKAHDASTKSDVTMLGKELATYFVDGTYPVTLDFVASPGHVLLSDGHGYVATVNLTNGTATPSSNSARNLGDAALWCVALTDVDGDVQAFRFSAASGLETGTC